MIIIEDVRVLEIYVWILMFTIVGILSIVALLNSFKARDSKTSEISNLTSKINDLERKIEELKKEKS